MTCFLDFIITAILLHSFRSSCSYLYIYIYIYEKMVPTASPNCGSVSSIGQIGPTAFWHYIFYPTRTQLYKHKSWCSNANVNWTAACISLSLPGHHHFFIHEKERKLFKRLQNHFMAIIHHGEDGGGGHWLVRMEWRPAIWLVCLPLLIFPWTTVQKFSSGTGSPGWSRKKGRKTVVVWCGIHHVSKQGRHQTHAVTLSTEPIFKIFHSNTCSKFAITWWSNIPQHLKCNFQQLLTTKRPAC